MSRTTRALGAMIVAAGFHASAAQAQSVTGRWDGTATTQQGGQAITVTLDSASEGWKGTASSDVGGTQPLFGITIKGDTVSFSLAIQSATVAMQGTLSADRKTMNGFIWVDGNDAGTFRVARAAAPAKPPAKTPTHTIF
jgi:hypothetical protein